MMSTPIQCAAAEALERYLGDPAHPRSRISWQRAVALDEADAFPADLIQVAQEFGVHRYAVPADLGGELRSFEEVYHISRALSRRDMVVAHVLGATLLGSVFTWLIGSNDPKTRLAAAILRGELDGLALTEEAHGADIAASEVLARPLPDGGYELTGNKWLINNGSRSWGLAVLAAVPIDDRRELGLFLVEKSAVREGSYACQPKLRSLGVRGLDLCEIRFERCVIPASARVGTLDSGVDTLKRGLYITRSLCAGLSLGAADTALRVAVGFARARQLYGATAFDIPEVRARIAGAFADLLLADCVAITAMRGIHVAPEQISVMSAVVKYWVPTTAEAAVRDLAIVLGARYYLREGETAIFQKMLRDGLVVSVFDGSTAVNQYVIGLQLPALARGLTEGRTRDTARAAQLFGVDRPLPPFDGSRLALVSGGHDIVIEGFADAIAQIERSSPEDEVTREIAHHGRALLGALERDSGACLTTQGTNRAADARTPERFEQAMRYAALHTAAASIQLWLHNRERFGEFFARGAWLALGLVRLRQRIGHATPSPSPELRMAVAAEAVRRVDAAQAFGAIPTAVAGHEDARDSKTPAAAMGGRMTELGTLVEDTHRARLSAEVERGDAP